MSKFKNAIWEHKETGIKYIEANRILAPYGTHELITLVAENYETDALTRSSFNLHDEFVRVVNEENENETIVQ